MSAARGVKKAASSSVEELEETVARISSHKGVVAVMILSELGEIIHSTFERPEQQAKILLKVKHLCQGLFDDEEVSFVRIRTTHHEILLSPSNDYILVVLHNPLISTVDKAV